MSFVNVLGQDRAKRFLRKLFHTGHIPHALLFTGLDGVGKATLARAFAQLLHCRTPRDSDACDECPACRKVSGGNHPDLLWIKSSGTSIRVGQIRELRSRLQFRPFEGQWRVVVIEDAQGLRDEAGNALLKILEEPPPHNVLILTAPEPQMLLATVASRCCHVRLQPLEPMFIERCLAADGSLSKLQVEEVVRVSGGSLERARHFADPDRLAHVEATVDRLARLEGIGAEGLFHLVSEWLQKTQSLDDDLETIRLWLRDLLVCRLTQGDRAVIRNFEGSLEKVGGMEADDLISLYFEVERTNRHIRQNVNKQLAMEGLCLDIKERLYGPSSRDLLP